MVVGTLSDLYVHPSTRFSGGAVEAVASRKPLCKFAD